MDSLAFECNYCDGVFCTEHRLPELHDCKALENPELFEKHHPDEDEDDDSPTRVEDIDLESEVHFTEIDVEPMELTRDQTVGTPTKSPISDSSPDIAPDGSLANGDDDNEQKADSESEDAEGRVTPLVSAVVLFVLLAAVAAFVLI